VEREVEDARIRVVPRLTVRDEVGYVPSEPHAGVRPERGLHVDLRREARKILVGPEAQADVDLPLRPSGVRDGERRREDAARLRQSHDVEHQVEEREVQVEERRRRRGEGLFEPRKDGAEMRGGAVGPADLPEMALPPGLRRDPNVPDLLVAPAAREDRDRHPPVATVHRQPVPRLPEPVPVLDVVVDDEEVRLREQVEVPAVRKVVGLHDDDAHQRQSPTAPFLSLTISGLRIEIVIS